jgi:hypothetical protein
LRCAEATSGRRGEVGEGRARHSTGRRSLTCTRKRSGSFLTSSSKRKKHHRRMASENKAVRTPQYHMRIGAFRSFDVDEAIKTSDRRKFEREAKKRPVPLSNEYSASVKSTSSINYAKLNCRRLAALFWALFVALYFLPCSQICC